MPASSPGRATRLRTRAGDAQRRQRSGHRGGRHAEAHRAAAPAAGRKERPHHQALAPGLGVRSAEPLRVQCRPDLAGAHHPGGAHPGGVDPVRV
ncbi:hypothetical protein G6F21_014540 [Rhizopus arrhizus]|nr:hypothetical protein G6F21_014540 [Rhizopus arrhizus]